MEHQTLDTALEAVTDRLAEEFNGIFSRETIADVVASSHESLRPYRVIEFVPLIVHRFTRERLRTTAIGHGTIAKDRPEVLFVCVHNAGRSQMAAGLLHHHGGVQIVVRSAGSAPTDQVSPAVIQAMNELGIDLSQEFPKPLTDESVQAADVVITMGCGDACPLFPGTQYLDWQLDDPAGQDLDSVRRIRDDIDARVRELLTQLIPPDPPTAAEPATPTRPNRISPT